MLVRWEWHNGPTFLFLNTVTTGVQCNVNNVYSTLTFQISLSKLVNKREELKMCVTKSEGLIISINSLSYKERKTDLYADCAISHHHFWPVV